MYLLPIYQAITLQDPPSNAAIARLSELVELWQNGGAWAFPALTGASAGSGAFLGEKKSWKGATYSVAFPKASLFGAGPLALLTS